MGEEVGEGGQEGESKEEGWHEKISGNMSEMSFPTFRHEYLIPSFKQFKSSKTITVQV